ncbi:MAG: LD-carboxypeptidase [Deltaproteobacteria bacterium]|nr:LD-carboxypeptidase [Deltaproteobacteria bacterium]
MLHPRPISSGRVAIFAGSSPFPPERYGRGIERIAELGLVAVEDSAIRARTGYLAGDDGERARVIVEALKDPSIEVLWAARGGYGLHRIIDRIDPSLLVGARKAIVGFSDVCVLHSAAQRNGLISIHGPVITQLGELDGPSHLPAIRAVLEGRWSGLEYRTDAPPIAGGVARGPVLGGCLSVLCSLVGTPFLPSFRGALVLLEDIGEPTYRIDRMLTHLLLAGAFEEVRGIAAGEFHECRPRFDGELLAHEVLEDRLSRLGVPVVHGLPFGHGSRNVPIPLGAIAELDGSGGRLVLV